VRFRITVRGDNLELRGYLDGEQTLLELADAMKGLGVVVASPADDSQPDEGHLRLSPDPRTVE